MAVYAIGDVQGCFDDLKRLLDKIRFDPVKDQLWFVGDLVNRGPKSLETLSFVKSLGSSAISVLGNHDLHLIATALGIRKPHRKDTLQDIIKSPHCDELIDWLRHCPLFYHDNGYCLLHAGLPPQWDFKKTKQMAAEAEAILQGENYREFFNHMYGDEPSSWHEDLQGMARIRFIVNCFTRMRYCDGNGVLDMEYKQAPDRQPEGLYPWFQLADRKSVDMKIIFGHWSTLGFYAGDNCFALDTGCLWGGELTALKLGKSVKRTSISCAGECEIT